eukprot:1160742-Pelagomonas_calceolata.AAC.3
MEGPYKRGCALMDRGHWAQQAQLHTAGIRIQLKQVQQYEVTFLHLFAECMQGHNRGTTGAAAHCWDKDPAQANAAVESHFLAPLCGVHAGAQQVQLRTAGQDPAQASAASVTPLSFTSLQKIMNRLNKRCCVLLGRVRLRLIQQSDIFALRLTA